MPRTVEMPDRCRSYRVQMMAAISLVYCLWDMILMEI